MPKKKNKRSCENCSHLVKTKEGIAICTSDKGRITRLISTDVCSSYDNSRTIIIYAIILLIIYSFIIYGVVMTIEYLD